MTDGIGHGGASVAPSPRRRRRFAFTLVGACLALGVLLVEIVARVAYRPEALLTGDDVWIARWLAPKKSGDGGATDEALPLAASGALHQPDPKLGWVPAANYSREGVTTNALGLRGSADIAFTKTAGERRVVAIGDSFTFGDGVRDEEVWTARLAAKLNVPVINAGVMGYGTDQQCLRLEELGMKFQPDVVLLGLFGPDLDRNVLSFRDAAKPRFVLSGDGLEFANVPVPAPDELRSRLKPPAIHSYAFALAQVGIEHVIDRTRFAPKRELARRILDRIDGVAKAGGAKLVVAWFPAKPSSFSREPTDDEALVVEWAAARNVALVNVRPAFANLSPADRKNVWHNHWTPFGNQVVADAIAEGFGTLGVLAPKDH